MSTTKIKPLLNGKIRFEDYHIPTLESGEYNIVVSQLMDLDYSPVVCYQNTLNFIVSTERFKINETDIQNVYPPPGTTPGGYNAVLPHVSFKRSSLPWERTAAQNPDLSELQNNPPWMTVMLFTEANAPKIQYCKAGDLTKSISGAQWQTITLDANEDEEQVVKYIDISCDTFSKLIPSANELQLLAHTRNREDDNGKPIGEEQAFVVCNQLPTPGEKCVAHLVSLESCYGDNTYKYDPAGDPVRVISLHSWSFECSDKSLAIFLSKIKTNTFKLPEVPAQNPGAADANNFLNQGFVPLKQYFRNGQVYPSWYYGP